MNKKSLLVFICAILLFSFYTVPVSMDTKEETLVFSDYEVGATLSEDHVFTTINENGEIVELDIEAMEEEVKAQHIQTQPYATGDAKVIEYGVVNFRTKESAGINTHYTEVDSNRSGYTNGYYAADGAFLGYSEDGKKVKFMQAGVIGWVNTSDVEVLDYDNEQEVQSVNYYAVRNGKLYHNGTTNISQPYYSLVSMIGYKPSYLKEKTPYYSYDGHYFYETYYKMIDDYKNNTRENAINAKEPYYNYYQYLSHRSKTNLTAEMLDQYIKENVTVNTEAGKDPIVPKMADMGKYFVEYQNTYGVNALLMYAVAANESYWGLSSIAQNKNNLFGHAAYDATPGASASGYESPKDSIYYHAKTFISEGYMDPKDYSGRYFGGHLGDKASGVNVKYASDPYWGEKAANVAWALHEKNETSKDAYHYTIAMKENIDTRKVYKDMNTTSTTLYQSGKVTHYPYLVLSKIKDSNDVEWFKIQSDSTLKSDRSDIIQDKGEYDFTNFYAYVEMKDLMIVNKGVNVKENGDIVETPSSPQPDTPDKEEDKEETPPEPTYLKGDVNGDGYISSRDYNTVKNHITGYKKVSGDVLKRADVNGDGYISSRDYNAIKNHITGYKKLF